MELKQFTTHSLAATRSAWLESAENLDIPTLDYEKELDWAEKHVNYGNANGDSFAYGIFNDGANDAIAIVDIVYSQRPRPTRGWLKMLEIKMAPMYAPAEIERDVNKSSELLDIYSQTISGTVMLTEYHPATVIKLYGRSDYLKQLLLALNERLNLKFGSKFSSKMEGRWLVCSVL